MFVKRFQINSLQKRNRNDISYSGNIIISKVKGFSKIKISTPMISKKMYYMKIKIIQLTNFSVMFVKSLQKKCITENKNNSIN